MKSTVSTSEGATPLRPYLEQLREDIARVLEAIQDLRLQREDDSVEDLPDALWTVKQVAARLGVSTRTVKTLIALGDLRPIWIGGSRRFDPQAIEAYIARRAEAGRKPSK